MLSHRDVSAFLGLNKTTSMWEQWHINKGSIQRQYQETARSFWSRSLRPQVLAGLQERYGCKLAPLESRHAFGIVKVSVDRLSRVDADYASENERDFARDAYEAELGQPIDLLYGFSAGVQEVDFVPVAGLVVQAKGLGISAVAVLDGEASRN